MKYSTSVLCLVVSTSILTACFVEVEDSSVVLEKRCDRSSECTVRGLPNALQELVPLELATGETELEIDLGDQDLLQADRELGPVTLQSRVLLNAMVVESLDGVALDGIERLQISQVDSAGCTSCNAEVIATYVRSARLADATRLVLVGNPRLNLLARGPLLALRIEASGRLPALDWMASLTFDAQLEARAE